MQRSIRKSIFKRELECIFVSNNIGDMKEKNKILDTLFINYSYGSLEYILKEELDKLDKIEQKLSAIKLDSRIIRDIKELLYVTKDLELDIKIRPLLVNEEKVCFFVGAGASKILNLPLWNELANNGLEYLHEEKFISFFELNKLKSELESPKQKLTILHEILGNDKEKIKAFYYKYLVLKEEDKKNLDKNPYDILNKFDVIKVTTNIDREWENKFKDYFDIKQEPEKHIYKSNFSSNIDFRSDFLYKIHGCLDFIPKNIDIRVLLRFIWFIY